MADYDESEYQPILTDSIRENVVVPFDCYILLKANGRIVRFLKSGNIFPADKVEKFKSFQVAQLHIRNIDHPAYLEYLRKFFKTPEGAAVLKNIEEKKKDGGGDTIGMPTDFSMDAGKVVEATQEESGIVRLLKDNVKALDDELRFRSDLSEQEATTIKNATDKITDEITKVEGGSLTDDDSETIVGQVTQKIEEEIQRITGVAMKHDSGKSVVVQGMIEGVRAEVRTMVGSQKKARTAEKPDDVEAAEREASESGQRIKTKIWKIKRLVDAKETGVVAESVNDMVAGLEKALGTKIILSNEVVKENEVQAAEAASAALNDVNALKEELIKALSPDSELHAKVESVIQKVNAVRELNAPKGSLKIAGGSGEAGPTAADRKAERDLDKLKDIIRRQKNLIGGLQEKLTTTEKSFGKLNDRWLSLQSQIKPDLGDKHAEEVNEFGATLSSTHDQYSSAKKHSEGLMRISSELSSTVKRKFKMAEKGKAEGGEERTEERTEERAEGGEVAKADSGPAEKSSGTSEDKVLSLQLQDAKSLLGSNESKITQLNTLVSENTNYIQALEKENFELKKTIVSEQAHLHKVEQDNSRLSEMASDVDRVITQYKADVHSRDETIRAMKDEVTFLQRDLNTFKSHYEKAGIAPENMKDRPDRLPMSAEFVAALADKEEKLAERLEEIEEKNQEIKELKREVAKLTGHAQGVNNLKKQMSAKYERLKVERETTMKAQDALNRKIMIMTNLSEKERQTISKLTIITEELRRDRMEYMNKTNAALKAHKEAQGKEMNLSNQVQAEQQKAKMVNEQNELLKKKQNQVLVDLATSQKQIKTMEGEIRVLKKQLLNASSGGGSGDLQALENKLEAMRKDNKALSNQIVLEQRRSDAANKELRALQLKTKKSA